MDRLISSNILRSFIFLGHEMSSAMNSVKNSSEIELVQRYLTAFGQNNLQQTLDCIHEKAVWHIDGDAIVKTVGIIQGHAAIKKWLEGFSLAFKPLHFSIKKMMSAEETVLVLGRFRHLVLKTNTVVDSDYVIKFELKDNKIIHYQIFEDSLLLSAVHADSSHGREVMINTTPYAWDDIGHGAPIIFLHGLFLDRSFWYDTIQNLSGYRCITFDMPGHALSGWRDQLNLDAIADDITLWIKEYGLEKVTLVGHSQGGMIAMRMAAEHPELIKNLVLINTSAREEYPERISSWCEREKKLRLNEMSRLDVFKEILSVKYSSQWLRQHENQAVLELNKMLTFNPHYLANALNAAVLTRRDIRGQIRSIKAKTIVLSGAMDLATPCELGVEIAGIIPKAEHQVVDQAAHSIPTESAKTVSDIINRILN